MATQTYAGHTVDLDAEGFLTKMTDWTPEVGTAIAQELGMVLTPTHWKVLEYARKEYTARKESPGPRQIVANTGITLKELYALFPKGPGKLVARVAGIPKPRACL